MELLIFVYLLSLETGFLPLPPTDPTWLDDKLTPPFRRIDVFPLFRP